jgi:hypothetical protein
MHGRPFLLIGLVVGLVTPLLAQQPAIVLEASELPAASHRRADGKGDLSLRWENLKFLFAGPDKIARGEITEAQVTVFDRASHRIVFQTDIYQVEGSDLRPGPNYTTRFSLELLGKDGKPYQVMVGSGVIDLVVPVSTPDPTADWWIATPLPWPDNHLPD